MLFTRVSPGVSLEQYGFSYRKSYSCATGDEGSSEAGGKDWE